MIAILAALILSSSVSAEPTLTLQARCLGVIDGDTIHCAIEGVGQPFSPIGVRLRGIDTPELRDKRPEVKAVAKQARERVRGLCLRKPVKLVAVGRDKYFRLVARVEVDGQDVGELLLSEGLAREYHGKGLKPWAD